MGDLGLYYCAAGTFAALFGGELALELLLLQSACYALSSALQGNQAAGMVRTWPIWSTSGFFRILVLAL